MPSLASYRGTPAFLHQIIESLHAVLTSDKPVIRPRCDRDERVSSQLAEADCGPYRRLLPHEDARVKAMAWASLNGLEAPQRRTPPATAR